MKDNKLIVFISLIFCFVILLINCIPARSSSDNNSGADYDISIVVDGSEIISGSSTVDYGSQFGSDDKTYTITNNGSAELNLTGTPKVSITGSGFTQFGSDPGSPISSGASTTFVIRFSSDASNSQKNGIVTIENDDSDEDPFTFNVTGYANC